MKAVLSLLFLGGAAFIFWHNGQDLADHIYVPQLRTVAGLDVPTSELITVVAAALVGCAFGLGAIVDISRQAGTRKKRR